MKDKQSKKVVIINDINSDTIERAILILRDAGTAQPVPQNSGIVAEAQNVISSYIRVTEKNRYAYPELNSKKSARRRGSCRRIIYALSALAAFFAVGYFILNILSGFLINI